MKPHSRNILAIIIACVAFVGAAGALKTIQSLPPGKLLAAAADSITDSASGAELVTDQAFFSSSTAPSDEASDKPAGAKAAAVTAATSSAKSTGTAPAQPPAPSSQPTPQLSEASSTPPTSSQPSDSAAVQAAASAISPAPQPADEITAEAYLVGDVSTGKVYLEKDGQAVLPFASMSKLITAIAATDRYSPTTTVEITDADAAVPPDGSGTHAGERYTVSELLYPMLLDSSNVAAEALASAVDRTRFLEAMSAYAWEIGMPNSFFADPTGLSERNAGTAEGFFALARYLFSHRPDILTITRTISTSVPATADHDAHVFASIHPFVTDPRFLGGKTGHTDAALDTMLTILDIKGHPIAFIVLRSDDRAKDTSLLADKVEAEL